MKADSVRAILASLGDTPRDCRDALLLALGYGFARRRSELVGLDYVRRGDGTGSVSLTPDIIELRLARAKNASPAGQTFVMPRGPNEAVARALERWVAIAGIEPGTPLLRRVYRSGRVGSERLDAQSVALIVKARMRTLLEAEGATPVAALQEAQDYRGHSLRVGFAVSAAEAGASVLAVQKALGHASPAMAARYAEAAELARMSPHNLAGVALGRSLRRRRPRARHQDPR
jgi:integrase